ncbi:MAG: Fe-S-containing hydro-lyase [Planctomycetota bacterium]
MNVIEIRPRLDDSTARSLRAGQRVSISGTLYTARDAAHERLCALLDSGEPLPVDLEGEIIYFTGPAPARAGYAVGSAGPTTSCRMDPFSPKLIRECGLKGMIGKGNRGEEVVRAMTEHGCVYFAAVGGAGALIARSIRSAEVVCYEDLGTEAIRRLEVENFPATVAIDCDGNSLYERGPS